MDEIDESWSLSLSERELVATKSIANRLEFAVLLAFFRRTGRFPRSLTEVDAAAITTLAQQLNVGATLRDNRALDRTIKRYRSEIRAAFGFRTATVADADELTTWLSNTAVPQNRNFEALNELLHAECRKRQIEPPAPERCERIINAAVHAREEQLYTATLASLSATSRERLDALLEPVNDQGDAPRARIIALRSDAGPIGVKSIRDELSKLEMIRRLELPDNLFADVHPHELELYRQRVAVEDPFELRRHPETTRLTWLAAFTFLRGRTITDMLVDLFIDMVHRINAKAERRVSNVLLDDLKRVTGKTNMLYRIATAAIANPSGTVCDVVFPVVGEATLQALVKEWKATDCFRSTLRTCIRSSYQSHYRQVIPQLLKILNFRSNNESHQPVIRALELITRYMGTKLRSFPSGEDVPLDFVPPLWRDAVVGEDSDGRPCVDRIAYEITVLNALRDQLRCKEVWVAGADRFRNPDDDVPADFEQQRDVYYDALHLPLGPEDFITGLREEMRTELQRLNDDLPRNSAVTFSNKDGGWIHLTPLDAQSEPQNIAALKDEVGREWSMTNLLDMVKEADLRLNFTDALHSVTSHENFARDVLRPRLLLCVYGIGTNTGLQRMNASGHGATYKDLVYTRRRYFSTDQVRNAVAIVANGTLHVRNPAIWGHGTNACAADSKHFGAWNQNLTTQWHMRYGGPGIMIYWHVERKSLCIHSQLKSPSSSEVASMIEGVIHHLTEMVVDRQYVDSHGQSEVAFAFCRLLGFQLLPRLKAIHKQKLYRPDAGKDHPYQRLDHVLVARSIDWELIRQQYDQMIKYATALRIGTAQTEAIFRRFTKSNIQHPTYRALAELGRAVKTVFLCRYLHSETLRREIHEGLNVIERWNGANDFVFFAKRGELASNRSEDHELSMLCLHLLQNCMVYINTLMLQRILERPHWAGRLTKEDLRALTPLIWEHVNPYGRYELDMESRLVI